MGLIFAFLAGLNAVNFAFFGSDECDLFSLAGDLGAEQTWECSLGPGSIMTLVGSVLLFGNSVLAFQIYKNLDPEWEESSAVAPVAGGAASKKKKEEDRELHEFQIPPGKIGITIAMDDDGHHTVIAIKEDSPNQDVFCVGDHVKMVNGHDVTKASNAELLEILSSAKKHERHILVDREVALGIDI